jgi:peptidoglycan/xylan/chitin deacetylase (PgdA/CDA1 family)
LLKAQRLLHIMSPEEVTQVARAGVAVELHTHRHRLFETWEPFHQEIEENRTYIRHVTDREPAHFCYPSGVFHGQCVPWLRALGIISATTCVPGYANESTEPLLLPRFVDSGLVTEAEFRAWVTGAIRFIGGTRARHVRNRRARSGLGQGSPRKHELK